MRRKHLIISRLLLVVMLLFSISTSVFAYSNPTPTYRNYQTGRFLSTSDQVKFTYTFYGERLYVVAVELFDDTGKSLGTKSSISTTGEFTWSVQANKYYRMTIHFTGDPYSSLNYSYK